MVPAAYAAPVTATTPTTPDLILPALADLLGCGADDLRPLLPQLIAAWTAEDGSGAIALRRTPRAQQEVLGGARPGPRQPQVALTLLRAAMTSGKLLSAYADDALLPGEALRRLGWRQAQATYADRLGHTLVGDPDLTPDAHGSDDTVSRIAVDASGRGVGICRAWLDGDTLTIGSPGVHPALRHTTLRHALLRASGDAARERGARGLIMQAWGDTPAETQADAELGLTAATVTPMHLSR